MPLLPAADYWRSRFPIFERQTYINSCSQGALSLDVRAAYDAYLTDWDTKGSPWDYWVERAETMRGAFARLINAKPAEVAVMTSVSAAVSALLSAMDFRGQRRKIVVADFAFPTVGQLAHAQELRGAQIVHVPIAGNQIPYEAFERAIDEETALVALSHISFRSGARQDARRHAPARKAARHSCRRPRRSTKAAGRRSAGWPRRGRFRRAGCQPRRGRAAARPLPRRPRHQRRHGAGEGGAA